MFKIVTTIKETLVADFISCPWAPSDYSELEIMLEVNDLENIAKGFQTLANVH